MSFIQVQRNEGRSGNKLCYVHWATSVWVSEKNQPVQKRVYLGHLDGQTGEVVISKGFPSRSGTRVPLQVLREKAAAGEDLEQWLRTPAGDAAEELLRDGPASVDIVGDVHLLQQLAAETGLDTALAEAFGPGDGAALLGLAFHQLAQGEPYYLAGYWLSERELPEAMRGAAVSQSNVYGLLMRTGADETSRQRFFRAWFARHKSASALICDTTSISTYAADLDLAEYGHNRDGEKLPQINLCLVADRDTGLPLWCRPLPGSIPDVAILERTVELLQDLGITDFRLSLDRGFYSEANLRDLLTADLPFTIGAPFSTNRARALFKQNRAALLTPKRSFYFNGHIMRHISAPWAVRMGDGTLTQIDAHLFYDPQCHDDRSIRLEKAVFDLEEKAGGEKFTSRSEAADWLQENAGLLRKCFAIRSTPDGAVTVERKPRAVALATARMGYTIVLSSVRGLGPHEALDEYRSRDQVEKLFDSLKNEDGQYRLRTGMDDSAEARLFIAFAALVLRAALEQKMRRAGLLKRMSTADVLAQLRRIKSVTTLSGRRFLLEIAKRHRVLLTKLGVPLPA